MVVVATAGHVDHGKSTLVRALTGTDPDRWPEERRRGLTLDLGFAHRLLPSGGSVSFVDLPGHRDYLANLLTGLLPAPAWLLVVDAAEGWRAQTEEHARVLAGIGARPGVVVVTKAATVGGPGARRASAEVGRALERHGLDPRSLVVTDALAAVGLDHLLDALDDLDRSTPVLDRGRPRLWVDRAFTVAGAGTVVTGTLSDGPLAVDGVMEVWPSAVRARIRGLQVHGEHVGEAAPGQRVAANLAGVPRAGVGRGAVLVEPGRWHPAVEVDVALRTGAGRLRGRGAHLLHVGTTSVPVTVRPLGRTGQARLRWRSPALPLLPGDAVVLRDTGPDEILGGGEVLDIDPVVAPARARPDRSIDRVVAERGWVPAADLERLTGVGRPPAVGEWVVSPEARTEAERAVSARVRDAGAAGLDIAALGPRDRALAEAMGTLELRRGRLRVRGATTDGVGRLREQLRASPFDLPSTAEVDAVAVEELIGAGEAVELDGWLASTDAVVAAARVVLALARRHDGGVTVSAAREALGASRRHTLALLAELDRRGVTIRRGSLREVEPDAIQHLGAIGSGR